MADSKATKLSPEDFPPTVKKFLHQMLQKFETAEMKTYPAIDRYIGDALHQVYKPMEGGNEQLGRKIFSILDAELGTKKTSSEAKNYKKILAAIQKSKILFAVELTALFNKANRFLTKESMQKEKDKIKKQIKDKVMVEGVENEDKESSQAEGASKNEDKHEAKGGNVKGLSKFKE